MSGHNSHHATSPEPVRCGHEAYQGYCAHCGVPIVNGVAQVPARSQPQSPSTSLSDEVIQAGADELANIFTEEGRLTYPELAERIYRAMKSKEQSND